MPRGPSRRRRRQARRVCTGTGTVCAACRCRRSPTASGRRRPDMRNARAWASRGAFRPRSVAGRCGLDGARSRRGPGAVCGGRRAAARGTSARLRDRDRSVSASPMEPRSQDGPSGAPQLRQTSQLPRRVAGRGYQVPLGTEPAPSFGDFGAGSPVDGPGALRARGTTTARLLVRAVPVPARAELDEARSSSASGSSTGRSCGS